MSPAGMPCLKLSCTRPRQMGPLMTAMFADLSNGQVENTVKGALALLGLALLQSVLSVRRPDGGACGCGTPLPGVSLKAPRLWWAL